VGEVAADDAGVERDGRDALVGVATVQLAGEEDVAQLAVAVGDLPKARAARDDVWMTVASLATRVGRSSWVSRKPARWLTWNVFSYPSTVRVRSPMIPPALFARTSMRRYAVESSSASRRTWSSSA